MRQTLILSAAEMATTMTPADYRAAVEDSFRQLAAGTMTLPEVVHIPARGGAFHIKSAASRGPAHYVAVKVNGNFPGNPTQNGLPTIQGAILLCDGNNGFPLAILDSAEITAQRTAAATAVAARYLADPAADFATLVGCGVQGRVQLRFLCELFPLKAVEVYDANPKIAAVFAAEMTSRIGIPVRAVTSLREAVLRSRIVVTCTTSRTGILGPEDVAPGTFIAAVGADNHDKQEILPELLARSAVVVDLLEQCAAIGDLHHALASGRMTRADVRGELAQVVTGAIRGRQSADEIVVFDSTGSAIQDVAVAGAIYEIAVSRGLGLRVDLGSRLA